jgi:hypothetical protein
MIPDQEIIKKVTLEISIRIECDQNFCSLACPFLRQERDMTNYLKLVKELGSLIKAHEKIPNAYTCKIFRNPQKQPSGEGTLFYTQISFLSVRVNRCYRVIRD